MRVIGTAGHVDHGKSTLVKCLTGIDPDRLDEEKNREMTIDLGFAWLTMPNKETIGIVDVPGHRDFIENMLAGIGGIDAAILVIAADEGVMPQTREHLAILDLLGIESGIVALSKIDLIDDPEWIDLVSQEVKEFLQGTSFANAPIIPVSGHSGSGIDMLLESLVACLDELPDNTNYHRPHLPVDRIFTVSGFGTVVTGTLSGGTFSVGDAVEIQPTGLTGRIRGMQSYHQSVEIALPGSRVAINLAGVDKSEINRGDVISFPGQLHPTVLVDVAFRHLPDASRPLKHNAEVKFFSGAAESIARVRLLADEELAPGQESWLQLKLENPVPLTRKDRFILRYPSPEETIGGGIVVNPNPGRRWRRFQQQVIDDLQIRLQGSPAERLEQITTSTISLKRTHLQDTSGYTDTELESAIQSAFAENRIVQLPDNTFIAASSLQSLTNQLLQFVVEFHRQNPLRLGIPREELRSRLAVKQNVFNVLLDMQKEEIIVESGLIRQPDHEIRFSPSQQNSIEQLMAKMQQAPYTPPSYTEAKEIAGHNVLNALIDLGQIIQVQQEVIFLRETYIELISGALDLIERDGSVTVKTLRDQFGTSRKYAIGLLEHTDAIGYTKRIGDERVRGRNADQFT